MWAGTGPHQLEGNCQTGPALGEYQRERVVQVDPPPSTVLAEGEYCIFLELMIVYYYNDSQVLFRLETIQIKYSVVISPIVMRGVEYHVMRM